MFYFQHIYKSHLNEVKFSMSNYLRDLIQVVLASSDALQTDIQRIQLLQKVKNSLRKGLNDNFLSIESRNLIR